MPTPDAETILADPSTPLWVSRALREALTCDPVDAANAAEVLAEVLRARCDAVLAADINRMPHERPAPPLSDDWPPERIEQLQAVAWRFAHFSRVAPRRPNPQPPRMRPGYVMYEGGGGMHLRCGYKLTPEGTCGCVPLDDEAP